MSGLLVPILVFFTLWFVFVAIIKRFRAKARRNALRSLIEEFGFEYFERLPGEQPKRFSFKKTPFVSPEVERFLERFAGCSAFDSCSWQGVNNIITGRWDDRDWLIFNWHAWRQEYRSNERVQATCVTTWSSISGNRFTIMPKMPLLGRLQQLAADKTVYPTHDEAFDKRFIILDEDIQTPGLINEALRRILLEKCAGASWWMRRLYVHDNMVLCIQFYYAKPEHIREMIVVLRDILTALQATQPYPRG